MPSRRIKWSATVSKRSLSLVRRDRSILDIELHYQFVFNLHCPADDADWLDAQIALLDRNVAAIPAIRPADGERDRPCLPVNGQAAGDGPAIGAGRLD